VAWRESMPRRSRPLNNEAWGSFWWKSKRHCEQADIVPGHPLGWVKRRRTQRAPRIPMVRARVVQMAAKLVIEPIFEADFQPGSYGFRPKKSATQALEAIRVAGNYADDFVAMCGTESRAREALRRIGLVMDYFVIQSLRGWQYRRGGQRPTRRPRLTWDRLYGMGLHRLMGTVRYPTQATSRRSS